MTDDELRALFTDSFVTNDGTQITELFNRPFVQEALLNALRRVAKASQPEAESIEKSRDIFREAFSHISMHIQFDDSEYGCMPRNEWFDHASVQDAVAEEHRLCGSSR